MTSHIPLLTITPRQWLCACLAFPIVTLGGVLLYLALHYPVGSLFGGGPLFLFVLSFAFEMIADVLGLPDFAAIFLFWVPYAIAAQHIIRKPRPASFHEARRLLWSGPLLTGYAYALSMPIAGLAHFISEASAKFIDVVGGMCVIGIAAFIIASIAGALFVVLLMQLTRLCIQLRIFFVEENNAD